MEMQNARDRENAKAKPYFQFDWKCKTLALEKMITQTIETETMYKTNRRDRDNVEAKP